MLTFLQVLNETYTATQDIADGGLVAHRLVNRTFDIATEVLYIDEYGERMTDVLAESFDYQSGQFTVCVARYCRTMHILLLLLL